jgi:U5 snRNP protein, DIM1 family
MSYFLPHLPSGWHVDEAIKSEEDRVVVIRFGHDWDSQCMKMDETLYAVSEKVQNYAVIYLTDITEVPDFNKVCFFVRFMPCMIARLRQMYELYDPCTVMFFYRCVTPSFVPVHLPSPCTRNKHIMIDLGTGNNNKMYVYSSLSSPRCLINFADVPATGLWTISKRSVLVNMTHVFMLSFIYQDDRHHRDGLSWSIERSRSRGVTERYVAGSTLPSALTIYFQIIRRVTDTEIIFYCLSLSIPVTLNVSTCTYSSNGSSAPGWAGVLKHLCLLSYEAM